MTITLIADALVASLLVATIITCYVLAKRIERLKADEAAMRQTVGALIAATDTAERAIGPHFAHDCGRVTPRVCSRTPARTCVCACACTGIVSCPDSGGSSAISNVSEA